MLGSLVKQISKRLSFSSQPSGSDRAETGMDEEVTLLRRQSTRKLMDEDAGKEVPEPSRKKSRSSLSHNSSNASSKLVQAASTNSKRGSFREETRTESITRKTSSGSLRQASASATRVESVTKRVSISRSASNARPSGIPKSPSLPKSSSLQKRSSLTSLVPAKKTKPGGKVIWYPAGSYLTVRNADGGFYLCRVACNVYNTTKEVRVRWLTQSGSDKTRYKLDYADVVDPSTVLLNVQVEKNGALYHMPEADLKETEKLLQLAEDVEKGKVSRDDIGSDVEEVVIVEPPAKKPRHEPKPKPEKKVKKEKAGGKKPERKPKMKKTDSQKKAARASKAAKKPTKPKKKTKKELALEELMLVPNPKIKIREKDPFFEDSLTLPFVSKYAHSRLLFRAVNTGDVKLVKKLLKDKEHVRSANYMRSIFDERNPLMVAIERGNMEVIKTLQEDEKLALERMKNNPPDKIMVDKLGTGSYNFRSLGVPFIRQITASRGCKEGNNALTKDVADMQRFGSIAHSGSMICTALRAGLKFEHLQKLSMFSGTAVTNVDEALAYGHCQLARDLIKEAVINYSHLGFHPIFHEVLGDKELKSCAPSLLKMRAKRTHQITPFHCAAINPNTKHLTKMMSVDPDVHVADRKGRRPIHFSAACSSSAPLELLMKNGGNPCDLDNAGNSPLHCACLANRPHNVEVLLKHAQSGKSFFTDPGQAKYGVGGINHANRSAETPIHIAARMGHLNVLKILVKHGATVDCPMSVSKFKLTPLMLAAQQGHMACVRFLVEKGAQVEQKDRLGRTPLMHAAMTGNTSLLSYFLHIGAKPNRGDNSDNTALHYAAAYGWYFAVELLLEAGADVNKANNWKTTPVSIAYMKGHMGIVDLLLNQPGVDINFQDEDGMTLVSVAAGSSMDADLYEQMEYLVKEKGALCNLINVRGQTPLHLVASNSLINADVETTSQLKEQDKEYIKTSLRISKLLVENRCDPKVVDDAGWTAAMYALTSKNVELLEYLLTMGSPILADSLEGTTVLHRLARNCMELVKIDHSALVKVLLEPRTKDSINRPEGYKKEVLQMAKMVDSEGYTPLLLACSNYSTCRANLSDKEKSEVLKFWQKGRDFIKMLIDVCQSDVSATVQKVKNPNKSPEMKYADSHGDRSPFFFMALANFEPAAHPDAKKDEKFPGMRMLLPYKPDVEHRAADNRTALNTAIQARNVEKVEFLLKEAKVNANSEAIVVKTVKGKQVKTGIPVICTATQSDKILTSLLNHGADPNVCNNQGQTLLNLIMESGQNVDVIVSTVDLLLKHKVDVNKPGKDGKTALHLAAIHNRGGMNDSIDLEVHLIQAGADPSKTDHDGCFPLHYVFRKGPNYEHKERNSASDPVELCRLIGRKMSAAAINTRNKEGETPLHGAAFRGANICCLYLVERGAKVNIKNDLGNTPLSIAVSRKLDNTATVLLQKGADLVDYVERNPNFKGAKASPGAVKTRKTPPWMWAALKAKPEEKEFKTTPIFQIAIKNEMPGVSFLILEMPFSTTGLTIIDAVEMAFKELKYIIALRLMSTIDELPLLEAKREHGRTLFHQFCLTSSADSDVALQEKVANMLLEKGLALTDEDDYKCTPIAYSVLRQNFPLARHLMGKPRTFNSKQLDKFGRSLLATAVWKTSSALSLGGNQLSTWQFLAYLKTRGISLNERNDIPMPKQLFGENIEHEVPDYFKSYDVKITPLILAIRLENLPMMRELLALHVDVNQPDSNGVLPLQHAAIVNNLDFVKMLMNHMYDPDKPEETLDPVAKAAKPKPVEKRHGGRKFALKRKLTMLSAEDEEEEEEEEEPAVKEKETEFRTLKLTSSLDLNAKDRKGRTAMHYLAAPLDLGTFDSEEFVYVLAKAGAHLDVKDREGKTPLDLAIEFHSVQVAKMIQKLKKVDERNMRLPSPDSVSVEDGVPKPSQVYNIQDDSQVMLNKLLEKEMEVEEKKVYKHTVNSSCTTQGSLARDEEQDLFYDVLLRKVDVSQGVWGMYNFYCMQIVHQEGKDLYVLFTRWGRIGDEGQFQHTPFQTKAEAVKEFCSIFRSKTGNTWKDVKDFEAKPKKYRLVTDEERIVQDDKKDNVEFELKSTVMSKLPKSLQSTVKDMMDVKALKRAYEKSTFRFSAMPFGRMQREHLLKARSLLDKISLCIVEVLKYRQNETPIINEDDKEAVQKRAEAVEKYQKACEEIASLSSEYFLLIPQPNYAFESIRPIDDEASVQKQLKLINDLLDFETARKMILGAMFRAKEISPMDYIYHSLHCKMQLLSENDPAVQYILQYAFSSNDQGHRRNSKPPPVTAVYALERAGEEERMRKKGVGNRMLLWHGTGSGNVLSILQRGLVIAPPDAPISGHLFGKGIYFSDSFQKSLGYCWNYSDSKKKYMLLCEVALGKKHVVQNISFDEKMEKCYDSVQCPGRIHSDEKYHVRLASETVMPLGQRKKARYNIRIGTSDVYIFAEFNEFIVYDEAQVCLRYLVQLEDGDEEEEDDEMDDDDDDDDDDDNGNDEDEDEDEADEDEEDEDDE